MTIAIPASRASSTARATSGRGGSCSPTRPRKTSSRSSSSAPEPAPGSSSRVAMASTRRAWPAKSSTAAWIAWRSCAPSSLTTPSAASRADRERISKGRPSHRAAAAVLLHDDRHPLALGVERHLAQSRRLAQLRLDVVARLLREHEQRPLGRVAEDAPAGVLVVDEPRVVALHPGTQQQAQGVGHGGRREGSLVSLQTALRGVADARRGERSAGAPDRAAVISPAVSVPVLSVQMTVVEPRVSTELRRLMSAFAAAIRCTPIASETDITPAVPPARGRPSRPARRGRRPRTARGPATAARAGRAEQHGHDRHAACGDRDLLLERAALGLDRARQR